MANFLIVSCLAEANALGIRLMGEGHQVKVYIHEKSEKDCGDGLLEKVNNWQENIDWADVIFFDDIDQKHKGESAYKSSEWSQQVREQYPDKLVIGGGHEDIHRLENDRIFAQEVMQQCGIPIVEMHRFTSFDDAKKFVEENGDKGWAVKHNNQVDRDAAGVFKTGEETIEFLDFLNKNWKELGNGEPPDFVLQERVEGIEIAVTAFFDGMHFRPETCYINQEEKKELTGGIGRSTGQMGEIGLIIPNARLFQETLLKLEPFYQNKGYIGWADCNCIVNEQRIVPLELTTGRPGYPTLFSFLNLLNEPVGEWLIRMARQDQNPVQMLPMCNCTLVLTTGTFPDQHPTRNKMAIIHGLEKTGLRNVWLCECKYDAEEDKITGAGVMGYLAVITGKGGNIPEAVQNAYEVIEQIDVIPYKKLRYDIGVRAMNEFPKLLEWGWLS